MIDGDDGENAGGIPLSSKAVEALAACDAVDPDVDSGDSGARSGDGDPFRSVSETLCDGPLGTISSADTSSEGTSSIGASGSDEIMAVIVAGYHKPSSCGIHESEF